MCIIKYTKEFVKVFFKIFLPERLVLFSEMRNGKTQGIAVTIKSFGQAFSKACGVKGQSPLAGF